MPRRISVPSYRLHKSSGQARVLIGGRHCYLGTYGSAESREKYARLIAEHCGPAAELRKTESSSDSDDDPLRHHDDQVEPDAGTLTVRFTVITHRAGDGAHASELQEQSGR